jgi:hypothetical protein
MFKKLSKLKAFIAVTAFVVSIAVFGKPNTSYALTVIPVNVTLYSTSGTPVYATPNVFSNVVVYLDRFVNVRVTGITDNGFYQVDIGGTYYIPGPYMVSQVEPVKTEKQKALENLDKFAQAYVNQLQQMDYYTNKSFALVDVTGDGVPEIIDGDGKEIYTYYNERAVMMYYSEIPITFYYSSKDNQLVGKYTWNCKDVWEIYNRDISLLPWGQFKCVSTNVTPYKKNLSEISKDYTNNEDTRDNMYEILKNILEL